jgi:hypothetical protein
MPANMHPSDHLAGGEGAHTVSTARLGAVGSRCRALGRQQVQGLGGGAHIQRVVIVLQVDEELRSLEVARGDAHVVLALQVVELGEAPVYQAQLPLLRGGRSARVGQGPARVGQGSARDGEAAGARAGLLQRAARWRRCAHFMVNHHVVRFDVAVHDPVGVAVLEGLRAQRDQRAGVGEVPPHPGDLCASTGVPARGRKQERGAWAGLTEL